MDDHNFEDLLQAIQSALFTAQEALKKQREDLLRRIREGDENGAAHSPVFAFSIPKSGGDRDGYEIYRLPAASFRSYPPPRLSMLALEFDCELKEKRLPGVPLAYTLLIRAGKKRWWQRKERRRMHIIFDGADRPSGEVRLDGELLMEVPMYCGAACGRPVVVTTWFTFPGMPNWWKELWRKNRFIMTGGPAERAGEILAKPDRERPAHGKAH